MTKFRAGAFLGLSVGYYLGARAGRGRYDQINRGIQILRRNHTLEHAVITMGRAKAIADLGRVRVHDVVDHQPVVLAR
jgi:hypothetical protein